VHGTRAQDPGDRWDFTPHDFADLRAAQTSFESVAGYYDGTVNLSGDHRPERYNGTFATPNLFDVLRVQPAMGRGFSPGSDQPGAPGEVILGHDTWLSRFAGDPGVVGRTIRVNGREATIVGVMPPKFSFPFVSAAYVPAMVDMSKIARGQGQPFAIVARLRDGVGFGEADAEVNTIVANLKKQYPDATPVDGGAAQEYHRRAVSPNTRSILTTMFVSVVFVLLIACANVANLLLARAAGRARETAIRNALGASRGRLVALTLTEAVVIALCGGLIGFVLAQWGGEMVMSALRTSDDPPPAWTTEVRVDLLSVAFAMGVALVAAMAAGLLPALRAANANPAEVMREGGGGTTGAMGRLGRVLVTGEIALCVVLLVCAGLTVRSSVALEHIDVGADTRGVLGGRLALFESAYPEEAQTVAFMEKLEQRLGAIPGVESAAITSSLPMMFVGGNTLEVEGQAPPEPGAEAFTREVSASPAFFDLLKVPVQQGRGFTTLDRPGSEAVAVVNRAFAEKHFPGRDPLGLRIRLGREGDTAREWRTIVGLVGNIQHDGENVQEDISTVYLPFAQRPTRFVSFAVRVPGDAHAFDGAVRDAVAAVDPDQPVYFLRTVDEWIEIAAFDHRLLATLFGLFGGFAVALAAAGLYAVLAYAVSQRTREIGVRRAIGADDRGIVRMVLRQGFTQVAVGLAIGMVIALGFARLLSEFLFGVTSFDPFTFVGSALLFMLVGLVAATVPTRRALRVEPIRALRYE
jgi:predicted permease